MPTLSNKQHETFARNRAAGFNQSQSVKRSDYVTVAPNNVASRLAKRPEVVARIAELKAGQHPDHLISRSWAELHLVDIIDKAKATNNLNAAKGAIELACRLNGLLVDRRESYRESVNVNVDALDPDALAKLLQREIGNLEVNDRTALLEASPALAEVIDVEALPVTDDPNE